MGPARKEPDLSTYAGRFAVRLRTLREKAKMTPEQVAEKLGVSYVTVYSWETGEKMPRIQNLPEIAKALNVKKTRNLLPDE